MIIYFEAKTIFFLVTIKYITISTKHQLFRLNTRNTMICGYLSHKNHL